MLQNAAIAVVTFVAVMGFMVLIHEWGHFVVAKLCGIRVETFSIGFGKRLFGVKRGGTDYRVAIIPLGGYVKMAGENPFEARAGAPDEFMSKPRWQRFLVALAGPTVNIVFAVALLTGLYMVSFPMPAFLDQPPVVGWVLDKSPADKVGMEPGDKIVSIDNKPMATWQDVLLEVSISGGQPLTITYEHAGQTLTKQIVPDTVGPDKAGEAGFVPQMRAKIGTLEPDMPAAKAGLKVNDEIVGINGQPVRSVPGMLAFLQKNKDKPVTLTVVRNGQEMTFSNIVPQLADGADGEKQYRLGFRGGEDEKVIQLPFGQALKRSLEENRRYATLVLQLVERIAQGRGSVKQFEGPPRIAQVMGSVAQEPGWTPLLALMAMISLNLGVVNLLPIPILDGGVILLLLIEGIIRRDISAKLKERIYQVAFVFILLFFSVVIVNDLGKMIPKLGQYLP